MERRKYKIGLGETLASVFYKRSDGKYFRL